MAAPLRALFYNEGAIGTGVLGHAAMAQTLSASTAAREDLTARHIGPGPEGPLARLIEHPVPGLFALSLDLQPTRWHLVQSRRARRAVRRALRDGPADVLLVHSHVSALLLAPIMRRWPTFLSVDSLIESYTRLGVWQRVRPWTNATLALSLLLERRALRQAHTVLAWTRWAADDATRTAPGARVLVWNPGVDVTRFRPASNAPGAKTRILFVGARFDAKGGADLLTALGSDLGARFELDVVSQEEPPAAPGLRWHRLGPGDDRLVALYQQADLFCLPSYVDAAPNSVVEALASGTAVVGSDVGGVPDLVGDAGVIVARGDRRALRETLLALAADPDRRDRLGRAGRARAEQRFDSRRQTARLLDLLREAR